MTYYANYQGPLLTSAILIDPVNNREDDYTTLFTFLYGPQQNWQDQLYPISSVFCNADIGKTLCLHFTNDNDDSNRKHYTKMIITSLDTILNPPLFMPMNQREM